MILIHVEIGILMMLIHLEVGMLNIESWLVNIIVTFVIWYDTSGNQNIKFGDRSGILHLGISILLLERDLELYILLLLTHLGVFMLLI